MTAETVTDLYTLDEATAEAGLLLKIIKGLNSSGIPLVDQVVQWLGINDTKPSAMDYRMAERFAAEMKTFGEIKSGPPGDRQALPLDFNPSRIRLL